MSSTQRFRPSWEGVNITTYNHCKRMLQCKFHFHLTTSNIRWLNSVCALLPYLSLGLTFEERWGSQGVDYYSHDSNYVVWMFHIRWNLSIKQNTKMQAASERILENITEKRAWRTTQHSLTDHSPWVEYKFGLQNQSTCQTECPWCFWTLGPFYS